MVPKAIRGTQDVLPEDVLIWSYIEAKAKEYFSLYGFREIRTPIIEQLDLFSRSLGESTDIVEKQMFVINRKDAKIVLRPEATASVARAFCEHNLYRNDPIKRYFYIGPMFRGERPQKGRLRQFHHIGVENLCADSFFADLELILMLWKFLNLLGLKKAVIKVNSIGCQEDRVKFRAFLKNRLKDKIHLLCEDCRRRYHRNVFRILDCKNISCRQIVSEYINEQDMLCDSCSFAFSQLIEKLRGYGVNFVVDKFLVRGLDYYNGTVFEVVHPELGKGQDALAAGGRYDGLVQEVSARKITTPAVGFAIGVERLIITMQQENLLGGFNLDSRPAVIVISQEKKFQDKAFEIVNVLRDNAISAIMDFSDRSMKAKMRLANRIGVRFVVIVGGIEVEQRSVKLRDMNLSQEDLVLEKDLVRRIKIGLKEG